MTEEQIKALARRHGIWIPMGSEEAQAVAGLGALIAEVRQPAPEAQPAAASTASLAPEAMREVVGWIVECQIAGKWVPQFPARPTRLGAETDMEMFKTPFKRVTELCRQHREGELLTKNGAEAWKDVPREGDWVADAGEVG